MKRYGSGALALTIVRFHTIEEVMSVALGAGASGELEESICNYRACFFFRPSDIWVETTGEIPGKRDSIDPETLAKIQRVRSEETRQASQKT
jgi:hypothetical protein